jgi:L-iditol 2-dehydrogenase
MKAARLHAYDDIRIEEFPMPIVGPRDALVKTGACGICSGDVMPWYIARKAPLVLGHEPAGEIVALGNEYEGPLAVGDRVFAHHHAPCLRCHRCRRGDYVQCETWRATKITPGGIAEYFLVPEINLSHDTLKLPPEVTIEDGTLVEPTACVVKSLRRAGIRKGDSILIIGLGVMGLLHVLLGRSFGAGQVIGADMTPYRLDKGLDFGADQVIDVSRGGMLDDVRAATDGRMPDIVIACPNSVAAMQDALSAVGNGGTVVLFSPAQPGEMLSFDPNELYFRDVSVVTSYSCGPDDTKEALGFIEQGIVTAEKLVTHRFGLEQTVAAYRTTAEARDSLKSLIIF